MGVASSSLSLSVDSGSLAAPSDLAYNQNVLWNYLVNWHKSHIDIELTNLSCYNGKHVAMVITGVYSESRCLKWQKFYRFYITCSYTAHWSFTFRTTLNRLPISLVSVSLNVILKSFFDPSDIVRRGKLPALEIPLSPLARLMWEPNSEHVAE